MNAYFQSRLPRPPSVALLSLGLLVFLSSARLARSAAAVQFNRDIRPALAENCFACHGPDHNARKADLRLDLKEGLFERTSKREPAVVPGNLEKSELWRRITTTDQDDLMPPPESHKKLSPEQIELFKRWILEGATWQGHWAYLKPERPAVPAPEQLEQLARTAPRPKAAARLRVPKNWVKNPIDAFILAKLLRHGLVPNPPADRRSLARRLSFDFTGLPPQPQIVDGFLQDRSPDAFAKLVQHFLNSPHYGEHRGRYWLDAARYADTHGLHFDNYREMWPYRDWVIKAFNRNLPFDQFTLEQLAGDLLAGATDDQEVATGFQRCNMTTNEGGTIEEENLANYANDRVTTTGWVFLGATLNCSACHDHKFDPFTTKDFYSMAAFYRNTLQTGFDRNIRESDLFKVVPQTEADRRRWQALPEELQAALKLRDEAAAQAGSAFTNWLADFKPDQMPAELRLPGEYLVAPLNEGSGAKISARLDGNKIEIAAPEAMAWFTNAGPYGFAPLFTKERHLLMGDLADFEVNEPFSFGAWVFVPDEFKGEGSIIARMSGDDEKNRGWELALRDEEFTAQIIHRTTNNRLEVRSTGKAVKRGEWQHLFATSDGTGRAPGVRLYLNGVEVNASRDANRLEGTTRSRHPLRIGSRQSGHALKNVAIQDVRIYRGRLSPVQIRALSAAPRLAQLLAQAQVSPTNDVPRDALRDYFLAAEHVGWSKAQGQLATLENEQALIRARSPVTLVQREKKDSEPMAQILFRGQYDKPKDKVAAATPAALHSWPRNAPTNRLGLAKWIVSPENPLTARVTVNRFWQEVFGVGLVRTAEDFGTTSEPPVNQELLDWLAVEFIESGWDIKHIFNLIATSSTYAQSAAVTREKLEKDPQNRLCSRGPRFRMDAEMIRDTALAASGLLVTKIGGPSVKPYQPEGVWEAVAMPESNTRFYERDVAEGSHRRSLYTFWKRAAPPATMDIFNAPSREICVVRRERTNTPLQALATLNDPQFVEAARALAEAALLRRKRSEEAMDEMALRLLSRPLTAREKSITSRVYQDMLDYYEKNEESARALMSIGDAKPSSDIPAARLAAMTMVANQLMNLDECLNK